MRLKRLAKQFLGSRLSAISNAVVIAACMSSIASAQGVSPSAAPPGSVQRYEGVGGFGYSLPDTIYFPPSSIERAEDAGKFAHTNYVLRTTKGARPAPMKHLTEAETPASLGCVYRVGPAYAGCNPATGGTLHPVGGWGAIALVDAFDDPTAAADISTFFESLRPACSKLYEGVR